MGFSADFGVPWSIKKLRPLNSTQRYIGFDWNLVEKSVALPEEKKNSILNLVELWITPETKFSAHNSLVLHGRLVFTTSIFHLIRPYLPSIVSFAKSFGDPRASLHPPRSMLRDLKWIKFLLLSLPNSMPLSLPEPMDLDWWGDASTSFGIGVVIGSFWAAWRWIPGSHPAPHSHFNIGWAETVAIELGVRLLIHLGLHHHSQCRHFLVHSDNAGVVEIIKKGRCRSEKSNAILKKVFCLLAEAKISIKSDWVQSHDNVSDPLSRGDISSFLAGFPKASVKISLPLPPHLAPMLQCL